MEPINNPGLDKIAHRFLVLSGKGGVGKSTVAVNMAGAMQNAGHSTCILDVDIHGPSVPSMLGIRHKKMTGESGGLKPVLTETGLAVVSIAFLLENQDDAVIWRGPRKFSIIRQFLAEIDWTGIECLVIDAPPGTGDEPMAVTELAGRIDGAVVVTTPQEIAVADVRKSVNFCKQLSVPILGVVENMSEFVCPHCGQATPLFGSGGGKTMSQNMGIPFLGSLPMMPELAGMADSGLLPVIAEPDGHIAQRFYNVLGSSPQLDHLINNKPGGTLMNQSINSVRVALPIVKGELSMHFGHCESFALYDVDMKNKTIISSNVLPSPEHQPGLLPKWLHEQGASYILAGGMGTRAQDLFTQNDIKVVTGAPVLKAEEVVRAWLDGTLATGSNVCDH